VPVKLPTNIKLTLHKALNTSTPALPGNLCKHPPFDTAAPAKGGSFSATGNFLGRTTTSNSQVTFSRLRFHHKMMQAAYQNHTKSRK